PPRFRQTAPCRPKAGLSTKGHRARIVYDKRRSATIASVTMSRARAYPDSVGIAVAKAARGSPTTARLLSPLPARLKVTVAKIAPVCKSILWTEILPAQHEVP